MSAPYEYVGEDVQLINGETSSRKSEGEIYTTVVDRCIDAIENNGNMLGLCTFSLAMVS